MVCMNVFFVHVVQLHAHHSGGIRINFLDHQHCWMLTDSLLIRVIQQQQIVWRVLMIHSVCSVVKVLWTVYQFVLKGWTQLRQLVIFVTCCSTKQVNAVKKAHMSNVRFFYFLNFLNLKYRCISLDCNFNWTISLNVYLKWFFKDIWTILSWVVKKISKIIIFIKN